MRSQDIVSPENQSATFIELFFDLVFVFSVTQVVGLLHDGITAASVGQAIIVFWMVWWAWTQFTWALNAADTTHPWIEMGVLLATAVAFFMAIGVPDAFHDRAMWFAGPYVAVRIIGLSLYVWVASADPAQKQAVQRFYIASLAGMLAVILGGLVGGDALYVFWACGILLDVVAAVMGAQSENWNLHPEHFSERHGLFVIIALGESLIVAAGGVTGVTLTGDLIKIALLAVLITCGFWWSYFSRAKPQLDHAMEISRGSQRSLMGRDVYSLLHFPMLLGVIAYAQIIEQIVAHPNEQLALEGRATLAAVFLLFVGGMGIALWRATHQWPMTRLGISLLTAVIIVVVADVAPYITLAIALVGLVMVAFSEQKDALLVETAEERPISQ